MDHIRNIQELIDENRESLPTALSIDVMRECQKAYEALPKLWKIHYTKVVAIGKNRITEEPKVAIVEEEPVRQVRYYWHELLESAKEKALTLAAIPPEVYHWEGVEAFQDREAHATVKRALLDTQSGGAQFVVAHGMGGTGTRAVR